jgi:hypothetical protein
MEQLLDFRAFHGGCSIFHGHYYDVGVHIYLRAAKSHVCFLYFAGTIMTGGHGLSLHMSVGERLAILLFGRPNSDCRLGAWIWPFQQKAKLTETGPAINIGPAN